MTRDILTCAIDRWTSIWGDPLLSGSVFMMAYAVAAFLAFRVARAGTSDDRALWGLCAGMLLFQVANTHLDLHAFPGSLGRCMAHAQGWYAQRATAKLMVFGVVVVLIALVFLWVLVRYHAALWSNILLSVGMILSLGFTLIRGVSLHGLEALYGRHLGPMTLSAIIEMTGVALVIIAAVRRLKYARLPTG